MTNQNFCNDSNFLRNDYSEGSIFIKKRRRVIYLQFKNGDWGFIKYLGSMSVIGSFYCNLVLLGLN